MDFYQPLERIYAQLEHLKTLANEGDSDLHIRLRQIAGVIADYTDCIAEAVDYDTDDEEEEDETSSGPKVCHEPIPADFPVQPLK